MDKDNQSHESGKRVAQKSAAVLLPPKCATSNIASQVIPVATTMAISEVIGNVICLCATERVMTPVMVPGGGKENQRRERLL